MANQIFPYRQYGVQGSEVSLLVVQPQCSTDPPSVAGTAYTGLVDLPYDETGIFPDYQAGNIMMNGDTLIMTYTSSTAVNLSENPDYNTVALPLFYNIPPNINHDQVEVIVYINFPVGSHDEQGKPMSQKVKRGSPSTQNPKIQPDDLHHITAHHTIQYSEKNAADGTNPANDFGVPRFQVIQSYTQSYQFFVLIVATNIYLNNWNVSPPQFIESNGGSQINMSFFGNSTGIFSQVIGIIASNQNQFSSVVTSNNQYNLLNYPQESAPIPISHYDYENNAIVM